MTTAAPVASDASNMRPERADGWARLRRLVSGTHVLALAGVMPFALLRDFGRRFAFAHFYIARVLILDVAVAAIQLAALGWLGWTGRMSAVTAFAALGGACGLTAVVWLCLARAKFVIR